MSAAAAAAVFTFSDPPDATPTLYMPTKSQVTAHREMVRNMSDPAPLLRDLALDLQNPCVARWICFLMLTSRTRSVDMIFEMYDAGKIPRGHFLDEARGKRPEAAQAYLDTCKRGQRVLETDDDALTRNARVGRLFAVSLHAVLDARRRRPVLAPMTSAEESLLEINLVRRAHDPIVREATQSHPAPQAAAHATDASSSSSDSEPNEASVSAEERKQRAISRAKSKAARRRR